jgi:hypothetical protein
MNPDDLAQERHDALNRQQQARAKLFTALYGLSVTVSARDFLDTFTDVASLLAGHAPLDEDRADWQCVTGALQLCLGRLRGGDAEGESNPNIL